ncbi:MAG: response regulator, partial [Gemmataceae bacterium]|nr:response regulator [Gemmataceae bacterium]
MPPTEPPADPHGMTLRVLLVEDNPSDAKLLEHELRRGGLALRAERVDTEPGFVAALADPPDLVLCDWQLPQFSALRALALLRERQPHTPFILVSGSIGEEAAVHALREGASDYLQKDRLGRLVPAVRQSLEKRALADAARHAVEALRRSERELAEAQRIARLGSWVWEPPTGRLWWSDTMYALLGLP